MDRITISELGGRLGRFSNAMLQYAFGAIYAEQYGCELQTPRWIGNDLFGLPHNPITQPPLPRWTELRDHLAQAEPPKGDVVVNHDFFGYAQYRTSWYAPHKVQFRMLFVPEYRHEARLLTPWDRLEHEGDTRVGIHIRRGDYGCYPHTPFYITPIRWYLAFLAKLWPTLNQPVLFVASEDRSLVDAFAEYNPQTTESLGIEMRTTPHTHYNYLAYDLANPTPWQMDFYPDFYFLSRCEVLIIPNSTYSFVAAMLNPCLEACYRSSLPLASRTHEQECFQLEPVWNTFPLQRDKIQNYLHLKDIYNLDNPYYKKVAR